MKRAMVIIMVVLSVSLGAAWTENSVVKAHAAGLHRPPMAFVASQASALLARAIDLASRATEPAIFLALGACFVSVAWALHRKSVKPSAE